METVGEYSIYEILPLIGHGATVHLLDWDIKVMSNRLMTFQHSIMCVECGAIGQIFKLQRHHDRERPHLNLFAIINGDDVLMTADHIIPKSRGGPDEVFNLQTMCHICNERKATEINTKYLTSKLLDIMKQDYPHILGDLCINV